jgi:hypothetical protein
MASSRRERKPRKVEVVMGKTPIEAVARLWSRERTNHEQIACPNRSGLLAAKDFFAHPWLDAGGEQHRLLD